MSDDYEPQHVPGPSHLPETVTVYEQAQGAGQGKIDMPGADPDLDDLRDRIEGFMPPRHTQHGMMASAKADELVFWLRAYRQRGRNGI